MALLDINISMGNGSNYLINAESNIITCLHGHLETSHHVRLKNYSQGFRVLGWNKKVISLIMALSKIFYVTTWRAYYMYKALFENQL